MSPGKLPAEQCHRTKRVSEVEMKAACVLERTDPLSPVHSTQEPAYPKIKEPFSRLSCKKKKNLPQETALLLNYISQLRAFSEVLAIYCSHAVRKARKENRQSKWEGIGRMPTPTPKDTIKTLRINSLKALRVLTTIQIANLT